MKKKVFILIFAVATLIGCSNNNLNNETNNDVNIETNNDVNIETNNNKNRDIKNEIQVDTFLDGITENDVTNCISNIDANIDEARGLVEACGIKEVEDAFTDDQKKFLDIKKKVNAGHYDIVEIYKEVSEIEYNIVVVYKEQASNLISINCVAKVDNMLYTFENNEGEIVIAKYNDNTDMRFNGNLYGSEVYIFKFDLTNDETLYLKSMMGRYDYLQLPIECTTEIKDNINKYIDSENYIELYKYMESLWKSNYSDDKIEIG